jgi:FkbM family methyltransferase
VSDFKVIWLRKYLTSKPNIIFDIGAYDAADSIRIKKKIPKADIYAFEASPRNYKEKVAVNAEKFKIRHYNLALSDKNEIIDFYDSYGVSDGSGSILSPTDMMSLHHPGLYFNKPIEVRSITIDDFCKQDSIHIIDLIHMDVQGAEHLVLSGMNRVQARMIFLEVCAGDIYRGAYSREQLNILLTNRGYVLVKRLLYDDLYLHEAEYQAYIKKGFRKHFYQVIEILQDLFICGRRYLLKPTSFFEKLLEIVRSECL